jgi:hypothetical protein
MPLAGQATHLIVSTEQVVASTPPHAASLLRRCAGKCGKERSLIP